MLAIGEVVEPGYRWVDERSEYRHTVAVKWDTSHEQSVAPQKRWATVTVAKVPDTLLKTMLGRIGPNRAWSIPCTVASPRRSSARANSFCMGRRGRERPTRPGDLQFGGIEAGRPQGADAVLGDSDRLRAAERELSHADSGTTASVGPLTRVTFHPSYTYEDFIEDFVPQAGGAGGLSLALEDGLFKRVCRAAQANPARPYLLLIDEINRGNVAKIMGELLTLIERDKRASP